MYIYEFPFLLDDLKTLLTVPLNVALRNLHTAIFQPNIHID